MTKFKGIAIFDLDETIIDSKHRTPNNPDGTLNLEAYFENKTRENIFNDSLLPIYKLIKYLYDRNDYYIVICTARDMNDDDFSFLAYHGIKYHKLINRNTVRITRTIEVYPDNKVEPKQLFEDINKGIFKVKDVYTGQDHLYKEYGLKYLSNFKQFKDLPKYFWDDATSVISHFRKKPDYTMINAKQVNKKLAA